MSVHKYTAGARTRNVVNIADPGGSSKAYELTAANASPSSPTDGFKNLHSQKTLHVLIHNNELVDGGSDVDVTDIGIWGYNASLGGVWSVLSVTERANAGDTLIYPKYNNLSVDKGKKLRLIIPIEGIERIYVKASTFSGTVSGGTLDIYLGVNSI